MSYERSRRSGGGAGGTPSASGAPGKRTLTSQIVQRKAQAGATAPDPAVADLPAGSGTPLAPEVSGAVGRATGEEVGDVRVHTGESSASAARALGARAFALGDDIHLGAGESPGDLHLMAHEAAHTLQQRGAGGGAQTKLAVSSPGDALEVEADRVADAAVSGGTAAVSIGAAAGVQRVTDPRLNYATGGDTEGKGLDSSILPFDKPNMPGMGGWRSAEILSKLTQVDEDAATFTDQVRCGANAVLAIAINNGPAAVNDLARKTMAKGAEVFREAMTNMGKSSGAKQKAAMQRASDAYEGSMRLLQPSVQITYRSATYRDLSMIAHCLKLVMAADPRGATTGHEVLDAQRMIGETIEGGVRGDLGRGGTRIRSVDHLKTLAAKLSPGDAFTLNVDTDELDRDPDRPISLTGEINHFVTLGKERRAATPDGEPRTFLYDPYPREGMSQYVYSNNPEFWYFFTDKNGEWKSVLLVGHTKAPTSH